MRYLVSCGKENDCNNEIKRKKDELDGYK